MKFEHCFLVQASLECVADFHRDPGSMAAITPPPVIVQVHSIPESVAEGQTMDFTLWLGPIPVRWKAAFEEVTSLGFHDRQVSGPFEKWIHQHRFLPLDENSTMVIDQIQIEFRRHPWWGLVGRMMWFNLPVLFAFRAWKTRQVLEKR